MEKRPSKMRIAIVRVVGELLFLYGLLGWIYGVIIQVAHPSMLPEGLSHLTIWKQTCALWYVDLNYYS